MSEKGQLSVHLLPATHVEGATGMTYSLEVEQVRLGFLYADKERFAFTWDGVVAFDRLLGETMSTFSAMGASLRHTHLVEASFILEGDDLVTAHLTDAHGRGKMAAILNAADHIAYARFDAIVYRRRARGSRDGVTYSFGADNPKAVELSQGSPSVSVQMPARGAWPRKFLEWVLKHHVESKRLKASHLDPNGVRQQIVGLLPGSLEEEASLWHGFAATVEDDIAAAAPDTMEVNDDFPEW